MPALDTTKILQRQSRHRTHSCLREGCDINLVDFYGPADPHQSFNLATTNAVFADLNGRSGYPLKFGIMEDKGALISSCPTSNQTESATLTCLENALSSDMDYIKANYASSGVYFTDGGNPVDFSFVTKSVWPILTAADWDTVWSAVKAHTDAYAAPFKYIHQFGSFTSRHMTTGVSAGCSRRFTVRRSSSGGDRAQAPHPPTSTTSIARARRIRHNSRLARCTRASMTTTHRGEEPRHRAAVRPGAAENGATKSPSISVARIRRFLTFRSLRGTITRKARLSRMGSTTATQSTLRSPESQLTWSLIASDSYASTATVHHFNIYYTDAAGNLYSARIEPAGNNEQHWISHRSCLGYVDCLCGNGGPAADHQSHVEWADLHSLIFRTV